MAKATNAFDTYTATANREELADVIYNISPADTPVLSAAGKKNVSNVTFDWQTDQLQAADSTGVLEGDDITADATPATTRESNVCQINRVTARSTGSQEASDAAGMTFIACLQHVSPRQRTEAQHGNSNLRSKTKPLGQRRRRATRVKAGFRLIAVAALLGQTHLVQSLMALSVRSLRHYSSQFSSLALMKAQSQLCWSSAALTSKLSQASLVVQMRVQ